MVPIVAVSAWETLDRWLEAAEKGVSETKIHKDQDNWDRNIPSSLTSDNYMANSSLLEA